MLNLQIYVPIIVAQDDILREWPQTIISRHVYGLNELIWVI